MSEFTSRCAVNIDMNTTVYLPSGFESKGGAELCLGSRPEADRLLPWKQALGSGEEGRAVLIRRLVSCLGGHRQSTFDARTEVKAVQSSPRCYAGAA